MSCSCECGNGCNNYTTPTSFSNVDISGSSIVGSTFSGGTITNSEIVGYSVDTIDDLEALVVSSLSVDVVQVLGYWAEGDGGGGLFRYDSSSVTPTDGGTVFSPDSGPGRWIRLFSGPVNVRWFGATGDGVTDDTSAIQAALDYGASVGCGVELAVGIYACSSLSITAVQEGFTFFGWSEKNYTDLNRGSVLKFSGSSDGLLVNASAAQSFLTIRGITFRGTSSTLSLLKILDTSYIKAVSCVFAGASGASGRGIRLSSVGGFAGVLTVMDCVFYGNRRAFYADGSDINVVNFNLNTFVDNTYGIWIGETTVASGGRNWTIDQNLFEGNTGYDIYGAGGLMSLTISNNYIEQNDDSNNNPRIYLTSNPAVSGNNKAVLIFGNLIQKELQAAGQTLIYVAVCEGLNVLSNTTVYGADTDRWFVQTVSCNLLRIERPQVPAYDKTTNPGYPTRIEGVSFMFTATDHDFQPFTGFEFCTHSVGYPPGSTTTTNRNYFTRKDSLMTCMFDITLAVKGTDTGNLLLMNLPLINQGPDAPVNFSFISGVAGTGPFTGYIQQGTSQISVLDAGVAVDYAVAVSAGARFKGSVTYLVTPVNNEDL